jgi:hypothetical protein
MIFLIEYNPPEGELIRCNEYRDSEEDIAKQERLRLELELKGNGLNHEVVILKAPDKTALESAFERYFRNLPEMTKTAAHEIEKVLSRK